MRGLGVLPNRIRRDFPLPGNGIKCQDWFWKSQSTTFGRRSPMSEITRVGVDLAKRVIQVLALNAAGLRVTGRALQRDKFLLDLRLLIGVEADLAVDIGDLQFERDRGIALRRGTRRVGYGSGLSVHRRLGVGRREVRRRPTRLRAAGGADCSRSTPRLEPRRPDPDHARAPRVACRRPGQQGHWRQGRSLS